MFARGRWGWGRGRLGEAHITQIMPPFVPISEALGNSLPPSTHPPFLLMSGLYFIIPQFALFTPHSTIGFQ